MINAKLKCWRAATPDLTEAPQWSDFALHDQVIDFSQSQAAIKQVPPLLRRRFNTLGRCVLSATMPLLNDADPMPAVFASRHGDTQLSLKLQSTLAKDEPLSPTDFSLAVHNAISGLLTIARKDISAVTAIAPTQALALHGMIESCSLLQEHPEVLCVLYDAPLPELQAGYVEPVTEPYAIAMVLSRTEGRSFSLSAGQTQPEHIEHTASPSTTDILAWLAGKQDAYLDAINSRLWLLKTATEC